MKLEVIHCTWCYYRKLSAYFVDTGAEAGQFAGVFAQALNEAIEVARDLQLLTGSHGERHTIVRQSSSADLPSQEDDAPGLTSQVRNCFVPCRD